MEAVHTLPSQQAIRPAVPPAATDRRPKFPADSGFLIELRLRVAAHFKDTGRRERDCPQMYLKTAIIFAWLVASYVLLVFVAQAWWQAVPAAVLLAHDGRGRLQPPARRGASGVFEISVGE